VRQIGELALSEQTKDLEITTYLIEALLRLEGFAGLRDGFRLARELTEKYWDGLYPLPDEEGLVTRLAPLSGLDGGEAEGALLSPLARVPITEVTTVGRFALAQYNQSKTLKKIKDPKVLEKKIAEGAISEEMFQKAVAETSSQFYHGLADDLVACTTELTRLSEALNARCAGQGPPTSKIRNALGEWMETLQHVAGNKLKSPEKLPEPNASPNGVPSRNGVPVSPAAKAGGFVAEVCQSREEALESLEKVADFFRRTERHSPVSYTLDQVVRWARMPLPELWAELIPEDATRKNIFKQVGIRQADEPPKGQTPKK
jgi:type VI secretion system protein ImpA